MISGLRLRARSSATELPVPPETVQAVRVSEAGCGSWLCHGVSKDRFVPKSFLHGKFLEPNIPSFETNPDQEGMHDVFSMKLPAGNLR